jgi:hypothetical protein
MNEPIPFRTPDSPGVHTYRYEAEMRQHIQAKRLAAENEARLKRWALPYLKKGYRFEELTQIHSEMAPGVNVLTALGLVRSSNVWPTTLWMRRQWRKVFRYGCADLVVGGEWLKKQISTTQPFRWLRWVKLFRRSAKK